MTENLKLFILVAGSSTSLATALLLGTFGDAALAQVARWTMFELPWNTHEKPQPRIILSAIIAFLVKETFIDQAPDV
jgi:hypothetical protein